MIEKIVNFLNSIKTIVLAVAAIITVFWGAYTHFETRYAYAEDVKHLKNEFYLYSKTTARDKLQDRVWELEDRYGGTGTPKAPADIKKQYREHLRQLEDFKKDVENLKDK